MFGRRSHFCNYAPKRQAMIVSLFAVCILRHIWFALCGYLVSGLEIRFSPGTFRNAQPGLVWGRQIFALLADISARASARLEAGSFLSGGHEIGVRFRALCSLKKSNFCTLSSQLVSAWFQWVAQKLRRRLRTPAHSLSVSIM